MVQGICPSGQRLQALLDDEGARGEVDELVHHLENCLDCQETLQELAAPSDVWTCMAWSLRNEARMEPALHRLVGQLKEEDPLPGEDGGLSFLRPTDKPDLLGLLDHYEVREEIGRGGMGVVLKALDPDLNRIVAVKVLSPWLTNNTTARRRFVREAKATAAVSHDHVVAVHGVSETDGLPYLIMQYVAGESLQERLDREGPLEVEEVVRIGLQTASGLAAAHAQGLIHRDVKPANLLLENGVARVKITDFGLAYMADNVGLTLNGVIAGTPEYMAPEQARGEVVDHRADLFSLGSVLYACCTGVPPFRGSTAMAVLRQVIDEEPPSIRSLNPDAPTWLEAFIARLMAKDPAQRFQTMAGAAELLEGYLAHLRQPTTVPAPQVPSLVGRIAERSAPPSRFRFADRFPPWAWISALAASVVLVVATAFWFQPGVTLLAQVLGQEKPPQQANFHQDFRGANLENSLLHPIDERVHCEPAGVRVTLSGGDGDRPSSGLATDATIHGDFEITGSFEILKADRPSTGYGVGVGLYAAVDAGTNDSVSLARRLMPDGTTWFFSDRMTPTKDDLQHQSKRVRSTANAGKLRLQRVGSRLRFFVAEEGQSDFVLVDDVEFSDEDIELVKFEASAGGSKSGLDCRLLDFTLRVDKLTDTGDLTADRFTDASSEEVKPRKWLLALTLCVGLLLSCGAVGWWLFARQRRAAKERINAIVGDQRKVSSSPSTVPALYFPCSACGKRLKVKVELAGKKVKCPQCGQAVAVPAADAYRSGRQPGPGLVVGGDTSKPEKKK
jgi:serine/threonine protein kinase/predicted RNA-binding Zn-ribbon protein involved in translation (DUF1610 family)